MKQAELLNIDRNLQVILEDLNTVTRMMEDRHPCNQVLHKIESIQRALRVLGCSLIAYQVRESIAFLQNNPDPDARIIEIVRLQDLYKEMIRTPYLK
jgi:DNA-binding FrmR family transcriptional regulator